MKSIVALLISMLAFTVVIAQQDTTYTIHYVKNYLKDQLPNHFGCGKSIVYGTYLYPFGSVDAFFMLVNPNTFGFNANCPRKETYVKIFGDAQDYSQLLGQRPQIVSQISGEIKRTHVQNVIIQWRYLPEQGKRSEASAALTNIVKDLKNAGLKVFIKAPASYFCLKVNGQRYILNQPADNFIIEMYGEQTGKYLTYESIIDSNVQVTSEDGYESNCGKYPNLLTLKRLYDGKKFYIEKTLDSALSGYLNPVRLQEIIQKAGNEVIPTFFYDDYPGQMVL